jgi:hypothetical protein
MAISSAGLPSFIHLLILSRLADLSLNLGFCAKHPHASTNSGFFSTFLKSLVLKLGNFSRSFVKLVIKVLSQPSKLFKILLLPLPAFTSSSASGLVRF